MTHPLVVLTRRPHTSRALRPISRVGSSRSRAARAMLVSGPLVQGMVILAMAGSNTVRLQPLNSQAGMRPRVNRGSSRDGTRRPSSGEAVSSHRMGQGSSNRGISRARGMRLTRTRSRNLAARRSGASIRPIHLKIRTRRAGSGVGGVNRHTICHINRSCPARLEPQGIFAGGSDARIPRHPSHRWRDL